MGQRRPIPQWLTMAVVIITLMTMPTSAEPGGGPRPAAASLGSDGRMNPGADDRCPVCAMFPARHPETAAAMTLHEGQKTYYFCSNGCLLRAWLRPMAYLNQTQTAIDRLAVRDFFSGRTLDGRHAFWVAGSNILDVMGPAIVTLGDPAHVDVFRKRHGGLTVFALDDLDDTLWHAISHHRLPTPHSGSSSAPAR